MIRRALGDLIGVAALFAALIVALWAAGDPCLTAYSMTETTLTGAAAYDAFAAACEEP